MQKRNVRKDEIERNGGKKVNDDERRNNKEEGWKTERCRKEIEEKII